MPTFSKIVQWARFEVLLGRFWPPCPMFDTPAVQCCIIFCIICPGYKIVLSNMAEIIAHSFKRLWRRQGNGNDAIAPPNH